MIGESVGTSSVQKLGLHPEAIWDPVSMKFLEPFSFSSAGSAPRSEQTGRGGHAPGPARSLANRVARAAMLIGPSRALPLGIAGEERNSSHMRERAPRSSWRRNDDQMR